MASVAGRHEWVVTLGPQEMLLVLKALGSRLRPEEVEAARELGDRLTAQKASVIDTTMRWNRKLLDNMDG